MNTLSRRGLIAGLTCLGAAVALAPSFAWAAAPSPAAAPKPGSPQFATWVMDQLDDMHRGASSHSVLEMEVQTKHWTRTMELEAWSLGEDYSLIRILSPKKERGTATLKANKDLFTYLAKTGRTIKIAGAMMGSSWMGSHLSNNDLVKSSRIADNYDLELKGKGMLQDVPHYVLAATARPDAVVVWGKIEVAVRHDNLLPTRQTFFDEDGTAVRVTEFLDYKQVGDRMLASRMRIRPIDGSGEFTMMTFKQMEFDVEVPKSLFTIQHLKSL